MTIQPTFDSVPPSRLTWRTVLDAWRSITRREIIAALLLGTAYNLYENIVFFARYIQTESPIKLAVVGYLRDQFPAFALMLCIVVADRITGKDGRRRLPYVVAVVVSAAVGAPLKVLVMFLAFPEWFDSGPISPILDFYEQSVTFFFAWLILGGVTTFVYTDWRRARAARDRRYKAEWERADTAKRTLESQLQAMQARVEPQFLFKTLGQVRDLYQADPSLGARMLDSLIAYLRAAMPKMRDTSSTLWQELELARAYLDIVKVRLGDRLTFAIEVPAELRHLRFPPMMLLPLIDHATTRGLDRSNPTRSIQILVQAKSNRVALTIADSNGGFAPETNDEGIAGIRERLGTLYGDDASLVLRACDEVATEAVLTLPPEESVPETSADSVTFQPLFPTSLPGI